MKSITMNLPPIRSIAWFACWVFVAVVGGSVLYAQIEGDRGVAPINSSGDYEVAGIEVNVRGKSAEDARQKGWQEAQRKAWNVLSKRSDRGGGALSDSALNGMVSAIVVEKEQIGPRRYVATLGVLFDRARAGQLLGLRGNRLRSAPMLVIPVYWSGGSPQVFENRTEWQRAWARFRTSDSAVDYIRPSGAGSDSLLVNAAQTGRRGRLWWRLILDQFGAADVVIPIARLERQWPGGPIVGRFTARYGPDNRFIGGFELRANDDTGLDQMLNQAIVRLDQLYTGALARGELQPDASLIIEEPVPEEELEDIEQNAGSGLEDGVVVPPITVGQVISVQLPTPDPASLASGERTLRGITGVSNVTTTSLALGGTSVIQVNYIGDIDALRNALEASGWNVRQGNNVLRIQRAAPQSDGG